jgi:predicted acylesterase/phospholipase RssA
MPDNTETGGKDKKPKMSIDELKYIVMEGGGARGNTYLGAIRALEEQLFFRVKKYHLDVIPKETIATTSNRSRGVMDYLKLDSSGKNYIPIIEGVAGASAGAITTFALVLGLNSKEIESVLDFDFTNFLSEIDAGKYRMINETSELAIGEDDKVDRAKGDLLRFRKGKAVGRKEIKFKYNLNSNKTEITGNNIKFVKRELIFNLIVNSALRGLISSASVVRRLFSKNSIQSNFEKFIQKIIDNLTKDGIASETTAAVVSRGVSALTLRVAFGSLFKIASKDIKLNGNTALALIKDRGMFSGFQVREFFYDLMILAATKETYFQKRLIEFYNNEFTNFKSKDVEGREFPPNNLSQEDFKIKLKSNNTVADFKIGERGKYIFSPNAKTLFTHLQDLTFREFWHIIKVEYAAAVSNYTTNSPLFFSDKYTPNFRVFESVGASMSIPPAIRPVFNASDVVFNVHNVYNEDAIHFLPNKKVLEIEIQVLVDGNPFKFVSIENGKQIFTKSDYELYEYAVKKGIQKFLLEKKKRYVDINNLLELNSFLDEMRLILIGDRDNLDQVEVVSWNPLEVTINNSTYLITKELLLFFYNAQFKGLLLDGGYFNNIPFNYFRDKGDKETLDGVLPIKLDGQFPPTFLNELGQKIPSLKLKIDDIMDKIDAELFSETESQINNSSIMVDPRDPDQELKLIEEQIKILFNKHANDALKNKKSIKTDRESVKKIVKEWYKYYGKHNEIKPWEIPRSIVEIAFTGYSYGAKRGQIRDMSDHNNIIPLYDYGVGTYDFDLKKVAILADLAQKVAEDSVNEYFAKPNN